MPTHRLKILTTDGRIRTFTGAERELEVLRNRLVFSIERDRFGIVRTLLASERVEVHIADLAAVGVLEPAEP